MIEDVNKYYKIVIGSRTYKGKIEAKDFLIKNWDKLKDKPVYLYSVGLESPESEGSKRSYEMIPQEIREGLAGYVKLIGQVDQSKLNIFQKIKLRSIQIETEHQMDRKSIEPVVSFLKGHEWTFEHNYRYV